MLKYTFWTLVFFTLSESKTFSLPYCVQSEEGLYCAYTSYEDCKNSKDPDEFCIENPNLEFIDSNEESFLDPYSAFSDFENLCVGNICWEYYQEICHETEMEVKEPLRCNYNY